MKTYWIVVEYEQDGGGVDMDDTEADEHGEGVFAPLYLTKEDAQTKADELNKEQSYNTWAVEEARVVERKMVQEEELLRMRMEEEQNAMDEIVERQEIHWKEHQDYVDEIPDVVEEIPDENIGD